MTTITETGLIRRWLYSTLTGDATLAAIFGTRWYRWRARAGAAYPLGIIRAQNPGVDLHATGAGRRVWVDTVYAVYGLAINDGPTLEAAAARLDALLDGKQASVTGGRIVASTRTGVLDFAVLENGVAYEALGGLYRIKAQTT